MADKNPVRGMQPMDEYEEMMYRRSPEGKAEMQRGAMKAIGAPAAIIAGATGMYGLGRDANKEEREKVKKGVAKRESEAAARENMKEHGMKKGGTVKSASARADGCAQRGKTKGRIV
jgi:hypothetical protein